MTMNCTTCRDHIDELLDRCLSAEQKTQVSRHLEQCASCRAFFDEEMAFMRELSRLPIPAMRPEFPAEAMANVRNSQPGRRHGNSFVVGFATAMVASVALWFGIIQFAPQSTTPHALHTVSLSVGQVQNVNLVFNSPEQLDEARFSLLLPAHAELDGYPGRRELAWTTSLRKGKNRLSLPLRVSSLTQGEIIARINHGRDEKVFRLKLDVRERSSDMAQLKPV